MENREKFVPQKAPEKQPPESKEELPPNVVVVETPEAKFRIGYNGPHFLFEYGDNLVGDLEKVDALILELMGFDYTLPKDVVEENFKKIKENELLISQYGKIIKKAEELGKPIFLGDITKVVSESLLTEGMQILEPIAGMALIASLIKDMSENKKMTRREFMLKAFGGSYALSKISNDTVEILYGFYKRGLPDEQSPVRKTTRFFDEVNDAIHPETRNKITIKLRNLLYAQKMKEVARKFKIKGRKTEVAVAIGSDHHEIEKDFLKEDEEIVKQISQLLSNPKLKDVREKIATIARFDFSEKENKWELTDRFKDPYLAKIEK